MSDDENRRASAANRGSEAARTAWTPRRSDAGRSGSTAWQPPPPDLLQAEIPAYKILGLLGQGGMGAVYKGWQTSLERHVAIKVLPPQLDDEDTQFTARFKQEARTMAKFTHPGIVGVHDAGESPAGLLFIVMEFIEGTDVARMIKSQGRLQPAHALAVTAHVCDALHYAHTRGVIHRDIKPANIMVDNEGQVKVADFGLAKSNDPGSGALTRSNLAMGTPDFVAPEALISGTLVDHRADLYAVGVMLHQMLTGEIPRGIFRPPSQKVGSDARFDAIIVKAMEQEREHRYQSAADIRRDLDAILTTPPEAPAQNTTPPRKPVMRGPGQSSQGAPDSHPAASTPPSRQRARTSGDPKSRSGGKTSGAGLVMAATGGLALLAIGAFAALRNFKGKSDGPTERVPPPARSGALTAPSLEPAAIKLWDTPEKIPGGAPGRRRWENGSVVLNGIALKHKEPLSRDVILRASLRMTSDADMRVRELGAIDAESEAFYKLILFPGQNKVVLACELGGDDKFLKSWQLRRSYSADEWVRLELRAVGSELTVSADGETLGTVTDESLPEAGGVGLFAGANGQFRDIVYVPLDKPAISSTALTKAVEPPAPPGSRTPVEPRAIRLWDSPERIPADVAGTTWENGALHLVNTAVKQGRPASRDLVLRASVRSNPSQRLPVIRIRDQGPVNGDRDAYYKILISGVQGETREISFGYGMQTTPLKSWTLPRSESADEWLAIEVRAEGPNFTISVDGMTLDRMTDETLGKPGGISLFAGDAFFRNVVYIPFDGGEDRPGASAPR